MKNLLIISCYLLIIFSSYAQNTCTPKEIIRAMTPGHIVIDTLYAFALPSYGLDDEYKGKVKEEGIIVATYELKEDPNQSATGVFKGNLFIKWYVNQKNQFLYDDIEDYSDAYFNNSFLGTWTSYKTSKSKPCNWGLHRIPCSGDLDYGAAEFSPNEKYYPYGWKDYTP